MKKSYLIDSIINRPATTIGHLVGYKNLIDLHNQWIKEAWDDPDPVGMLAFRGSYKTSAVVIIGIIRHLCLYPKSRIFLIRKTYTDAAETLGAISAIFAKPEIQSVFSLLWGECTIVEDTQKRFTLSSKPVEKKEASINAFGIGDSITGNHADVIITDDILNISDRVSAAARKQTLTAFYELQNIIDPIGKTGMPPKQIFNGTRWHKDDVWTAIEKIAKIYEYKASDWWTKLFPVDALEKKRRLYPRRSLP